MKSILFVYFVFLTNVCNSQPIIEFKSLEYNYNTLAYPSPPDRQIPKIEFVFYNKGNEPLIISNVSAGWCCPRWSKQPISPNDSGSIIIVCDPFGDHIGPFHVTGTVYSNAKNGSQLIQWHGKILPQDSGNIYLWNIYWADDIFDHKRYTYAKLYYERALKTEFNEQYPQSRINICDSLCNTTISKKDYWIVREWADDSYDNKRYLEAIKYYKRVFEIEPNDSWAKDRIENCNMFLNNKSSINENNK